MLINEKTFENVDVLHAVTGSFSEVRTDFIASKRVMYESINFVIQIIVINHVNLQCYHCEGI